MYASESTLITPSRSSTTTFFAEVGMAARSGCESGDVGDAVHLLMQCAEQRQTVGAQHRIFGVDHHVVEKGIDAFAQRRERGQCTRVVAFRELRLHARRDLLELRVQRLLSRFDEESRLRTARRCAFRLLLDVLY